jgi:hypothetical protein
MRTCSGRMQQWFEVLLLAAVAGGCIPPTLISPRTLVDAARSDILAETDKYVGRRFQFTSTIKAKDIIYGRMAADGGTDMGPLDAASMRRIGMPVLVFEPDVYCIFDSDDMEEIAALKAGQRLTVVCTLMYYRPVAGRRLPFMTDCRVDK